MESNLLTRIKTSLVISIPILLLIERSRFYPELQWWLLGVAILAVALSAVEFVKITKDNLNFIVIIPPSGSILSLFFEAEYKLPISAFDLVIGVLFISVIIKGRFNIDILTSNIVNGFLGLISIGLGGASLISIFSYNNAPILILWLMAVVFCNDIAAYFGGKRFGGHKLAPAISPQKTVSGAICGLVAGAIIGIISGSLVGINKSITFILLLSVCCVVAAQLGDLCKSVIKRRCNVKDSGGLLPGHGGIWDRIDGLLLAAPVFFLGLRYIL